MTNTPAKLREAEFFLQLLQRLESTGEPFLQESAVRDEFSFVLSGLLNAFYAATEHMKPKAGVLAVQIFKKDHPIIFDSKTGLRNLTVHERHVSPARTAYFAPKGRADLIFAEPAKKSTDLVFRSEYFVEAGGDPLHINGLVKQQYIALSEFAARHGITTEA